jgi:hypothetical protein
MAFDFQQLFGDDPEKSWEKAVNNLNDAISVYTSTQDIALAFAAFSYTLTEFYGGMYLMRHIEELLFASSENLDSVKENLMLEGLMSLIHEPKIQQLFATRHVPDNVLINAVEKVKDASRYEGVIECTCCETRYPVLRGLTYKICPVCRQRL